MTANRPAGLPSTIAEFAAALRSGQFTAVKMTERVLEASEDSQASINAFITITADHALRQAARVDADLAEGNDLGPLMGIPIGVKDVFDIEGIPTTAGSRLFADNTPTRTATAVARLTSHGAVVIGKTNMDQFAFGPHQDDFGRTNCPADTDYYAGGSSGGSAAAVASGLVLAALGSDAGGSTRFPAACCGVVGFKPSFGRVATAGVFPTFRSVNHVGELTRSVEDMRTVFAAIANRYGDADRRLGGAPRIAVLADWQRDCDATVLAAIPKALAAAQASGASILEGCAVAGMDNAVETLVTTVGPEALFALQPYLDGNSFELPGALAGLLASAAEQRSTDYVKAQHARTALREAVDEALESVDVLVMPTSATQAWRWADIDDADMGVHARSTRFLPAANLTGHPAISVPVPSSGLPVGLQMMTRTGQDEFLFDVAAWVEQSLRSDATTRDRAGEADRAGSTSI